MFPNVFAILNVAAVNAIVGARIYRHGFAPENVAAPYVTWFIASGTPEILLEGTPPVDNVSVQVDAWTENTGAGLAQLSALGTALRDAIEAAHDLTQFSGDGKDFETSRYRLTITFSVWNARG